MSRDESRDLTQLDPLFRAPGGGPTLDVLGVMHSYKLMASDNGGHVPAFETIVAIAAQYGVAIHPSVD